VHHTLLECISTVIVTGYKDTTFVMVIFSTLVHPGHLSHPFVHIGLPLAFFFAALPFSSVALAQASSIACADLIHHPYRR